MTGKPHIAKVNWPVDDGGFLVRFRIVACSSRPPFLQQESQILGGGARLPFSPMVDFLQI